MTPHLDFDSFQLDDVERARVALGLGYKTCLTCRHWYRPGGGQPHCTISQYWVCWGMHGHTKIYPPPRWEPRNG